MIGRFAISKAGHDKGSLYVIVAEEGDYVYLADGRLKSPDKPKKKLKKHIQPVYESVEQKLVEKLTSGEKVMPEEIKYAIKCYKH